MLGGDDIVFIVATLGPIDDMPAVMRVAPAEDQRVHFGGHERRGHELEERAVRAVTRVVVSRGPVVFNRRRPLSASGE